ncbi:unnamed protein product [Nyctereutes procyonoides]|uniref:(raccoon dog) hypothetical protein n=1 Tax=Nyctereutes procyonoides TaxID=34880 RepID=A0A811ZPW6_NYCPR|nr:unnamed protein product [Nyctereutes procyonoides]
MNVRGSFWLLVRQRQRCNCLWLSGIWVRRIPAASTLPPEFNPDEINVMYLRCTGSEASATSVLAPKVGLLGLSPENLRIVLKMIIQNRQAQIKVVPSASFLIIETLKDPPRDRKKQKTLSAMWPQSLARELFRIIKEILGTAQPVDCNIDGHHPHDIIDDINGGAVECPAS